MSGVGIIIAHAAGGIQLRRRDGAICAARRSTHAGAHLRRRGFVGREFGVGRVFAVGGAGSGGIGHDAADRVVGRVEEVHVGERALVGVASPGVEDVACEGVQVDEPADFGIGVHDPFDALGFGLGEGSGSYRRGLSVFELEGGWRGDDVPWKTSDAGSAEAISFRALSANFVKSHRKSKLRFRSTPALFPVPDLGFRFLRQQLLVDWS